MAKVNYDALWFGTIIGIVLTVITFLVVYLVREPGTGLAVYIHRLYFLNLMSPVLSLCLLPNLLPFFIFLRFERFRSAYGVILSLFIFGLLILMLKFNVI